MTLYSLMRQLLKFATRLYFVEVSTVDKEKVPEDGPVILAANHPSSILDSVLLATELPRPVHYLAKSELFKSPILSALYKKMGAIPIERGLQPEQHEETFLRLYQLMESGRCVGIFPEGRNSPQMQVAKLRTGTARIAFGAEVRNQWKLGLKIVPVGLNFESRELFLSAVQLRFGDPISVSDFQEAHAENPKVAIRGLTDAMEQQLRELTLHIEDRNLTRLVKDLGQVYSTEVSVRAEQSAEGKRPLRRSRSRLGRIGQKMLSWFRPQLIEPVDISSNLKGRQEISQVLSKANASEPEAVEDLRNRVDRYQAHLRQTYLRDDLRQSFDQPLKERLIRLRMTLYALLVAPIALFGLVHNIVPYLFSLYMGQRFRDEAVRGFAYFGVGVLAFAMTYTVFGFWMWQFTDRSLAGSLIYLALLPPTGFVCLRYRGRVMQYRDMILVRTFFRTNENMTALLREERSEIIERLQWLHERYGASDT
ncbi:MAG: lysophospholipid acyltransferase family protein [Natronospirillum sp.]|uniref:lysophospholipid acyltransferase family protein n=1 Tax=Natronospirillum sp. TaxID=2812955 RepID=UPI0025D58104|nr:lysophospholipid acyltransferase family protein [Natronospirillum sp.]MCH8552072.1 lysophospholipid acyltransferase family protein [Natronospirillum sp.]